MVRGISKANISTNTFIKYALFFKSLEKIMFFKENCDFEDYLDILSDKERITLCKFRTLIIETGRWHNIDRDDRICTLCNAGLTGEEFHYLLECTYFNDDIKSFLGENYCVRRNTMKYKNLVSTKIFLC